MGKLGAVAACLLFAVPFGGVGAWATWSIGSTLNDAWRARQWVRVPATVENASLATSSNSDGDDTFRAEGRYRYEFGGKGYTSARLGLSTMGGSDNIDDWHQEVSARLEAARAAGRPVDVWVNPEKPAEAVFDRGVRWGEVLFLIPFSLAFGGVGVGALVVMGYVLTGKGPGPWSRRAPDRAAGSDGKESRPSGDSAPLFLWIFAFFWNALSWPIAVLVVKDVSRTGEWLGLVVLLFPLVGLLVLWGAIAATWGTFAKRRRSATPPAAAAGSMASQARRAMFDPAGPGSGQALAGRPAAPAVQIPASVATVTEAGGVLTIRYNTRRRLGLAVALLLVGLFVAGIGVAFLVDGETMVGGIAMLAVGAAFDLWAAALLVGRLEVRAQAGELTVERFGLAGRTTARIRRDSIQAIRPVQSYSVNEEPYFSIQADLGGERVALGNSVKGEALAVAIARRIAATVGLDPARVAAAETYD